MLDYTGINPKFKVHDELITPSSLVGNRYSPVKGAFYAQSVTLLKMSDGQPFTDIKFKELDVLNTAKSAVSAGPIYFIIEFPNGLNEDVYLTYQVVDLSNDPKSAELTRVLKNLDQLNRTYRVEDIDGERPTLPIKKHKHKLSENTVASIANALLSFLPKEVEEIKTTFASLLNGYLKSDMIISGETPESVVAAINTQFAALASLLQQLDGALPTNPGGLDTVALSIVGAINEILVTLTNLNNEVTDQLKVSPSINGDMDLTTQMDGVSKFWLVTSVTEVTINGDFLDGTTSGKFVNGDMLFYDSTTNKLVKRNPNNKIDQKQTLHDPNLSGANKNTLEVLGDLWTFYVSLTTGYSPTALLDGNGNITNLKYCRKKANLTVNTALPIDTEYFSYYAVTCESNETVVVTGPWKDGATEKTLVRNDHVVYQNVTGKLELVDPRDLGFVPFTSLVASGFSTENKALDRAINELYVRLNLVPTEDVTLVGQLWDSGYKYISDITPNAAGVYIITDAPESDNDAWIIDVHNAFIKAPYWNNGSPITAPYQRPYGGLIAAQPGQPYWYTIQPENTDHLNGRVILIDTNTDQPSINIGGDKTVVVVYNTTVVDNNKVSRLADNYKLLSSITPDQDGNRTLPLPDAVENYIVDVEDGLVMATWYNQGNIGSFLINRSIGELITARPDKFSWDVITQGVLAAYPHAVVYYDPVTTQPTLLTPDVSHNTSKLTELTYYPPGTKHDVIDVLNDIHKTNELVQGVSSINLIDYLTDDTDISASCVGSIDKQWVVASEKVEVIAPFENNTNEMELGLGVVLYYSGSSGEVSIGNVDTYPMGYAREFEPGLITDDKTPVGALLEIERTVNATGYRTGDIFHSYRDFIPSVAIPLGSAPVSRSTYANLFAKIGTKFGVGDGSTTFGIPPKEKHILKGELLPPVGLGTLLTNRPNQDVPANRTIEGCSSIIAHKGGFVVIDAHISDDETINDSTMTWYTSLGHVYTSVVYTPPLTLSKYDKPFAFKFPNKDKLVVRRGNVWSNIDMFGAGLWGGSDNAITSTSPEFVGVAYDSISEELFTLRADSSVVYGPNVTLERRSFVESAPLPIEETWALVKPDNGYINDLARVDGSDYVFVAETTGLYRVNLLTNSYVRVPLDYQGSQITDIRALVYDKNLDILYLSGGALGTNGESYIYSLSNPTLVTTGDLALHLTGVNNLTIKGLTIQDGAVSYVGNNPIETTKLSTLAAHTRRYNIEDSSVDLIVTQDPPYAGEHSGIVDESVVFSTDGTSVYTELFRDNQLINRISYPAGTLPAPVKAAADAVYFDKYGKWFYLHNTGTDVFVSYFNRDGSRATWSFTSSSTLQSLSSAPGSDYIASIAAPSADSNGSSLYCLLPDPRPDVDGGYFIVNLQDGALAGHMVQASDGDTHYYVSSSLVTVGDGVVGRPIREIKNTRSAATERAVGYLPSGEVPVKTSYHYELDLMLIATHVGHLYCLNTKTYEMTKITPNQFQSFDLNKRLSLTSGGTNGDLALADSGTGNNGIHFYDFQRTPTQFIRT